MILEEVSKPDETNKIDSDKKYNSADHKSHLDLLDDGDSQKDHSDSQEHVFNGNRTNVAILIVVDIEQ